MDTGQEKLCVALRLYTQLILQNVERTHQEILNMVEENNKSNNSNTSSKISLLITDILETYINILHTIGKKSEAVASMSKELNSVNDVANQIKELQVYPKILETKRNISDYDSDSSLDSVSFESSDSKDADYQSFDSSEETTSTNTSESSFDSSEETVHYYNKILTIEKTNSFHTFEGEQVIKKVRFQKPNPLKVQGSAAAKIKQIRIFDRREEFLKSLERPNLIRNKWDWTVLPRKPKTKIDKTQKERPTFVISDDDLRVGQNCYFCFIESPSEFYLRTNHALFEKFESEFNKDMNKRHQYIVNRCRNKIEAKKSLGTFCVGYLPEKSMWYRLEVLDWLDDEPEDVFVQLVDYGPKYYWRYTYLKRLVDGIYCGFSKLAIKCHLAYISPVSSAVTQWPKEAVDFFVEISQMDVMYFVPIYVYKEMDSFAVDLRNAEDLNADTLSEILISNHHAAEIKIEEGEADG